MEKLLLLGGVDPPIPKHELLLCARCCWGGGEINPPSPERRAAAAFPIGTILIKFKERLPYMS